MTERENSRRCNGGREIVGREAGLARIASFCQSERGKE